MKKLDTITSVCPGCYQEGKVKQIKADIVEDKGKVWITKSCPRHGEFKEIYGEEAVRVGAGLGGA